MSKPYEPDDPTLLVGTALPQGDLETMAVSIVEEYVRLGADDAQLLALFRSPVYRLTYAIRQSRGEAYVQALIEQARARWGRPRFTSERRPDD